MNDVIVVGGGIVGATIGKALKMQGREVLILDDNKALGGSRPSGGHIKPSWVPMLEHGTITKSLQMLERIWGVKSEEFMVRETEKHTTMFRVDMDKVMEYEKTMAKVTSLAGLQKPHPVVNCTGLGVLQCKLLIVAAGVWCPELIKGIGMKYRMQSKRGISFRYSGKLKEPFIEQWAPYKQIVAHQQEANEIWVGEGSAILQANWTQERSKACEQRCREALETTQSPTSIYHGCRPYALPVDPSHPCLFLKLGPSAYLVTGTGKLGTVSAGWAAERIIKETC